MRSTLFLIPSPLLLSQLLGNLRIDGRIERQRFSGISQQELDEITMFIRRECNSVSHGDPPIEFPADSLPNYFREKEREEVDRGVHGAEVGETSARKSNDFRN